MRAAVIAGGLLVAALAGCKSKPTVPAPYRHDNPTFTLYYPADMTVAKTEHVDRESTSISISNHDDSKDVLLVWAKKGSDMDPWGLWERYGFEDDNVKVLAEGKLEGDGKWIVNERKNGRIFIHAVVTAGDYGVLCMSSVDAKATDQSVLEVCKGLMLH